MHMYCGIKVNCISMMNDPSVDLIPANSYFTASKLKRKVYNHTRNTRIQSVDERKKN